MRKVTKWTDDEIDFIKNNYKKMSDEEIAEVLGKRERAVSYQRRKNGWVEKKKRPISKSKANQLINYLEKNPRKSISEVSRRLKVSTATVIRYRERMGLESLELYVTEPRKDLSYEQRRMLRKAILVRLNKCPDKNNIVCECQHCIESRTITKIYEKYINEDEYFLKILHLLEDKK